MLEHPKTEDTSPYLLMDSDNSSDVTMGNQQETEAKVSSDSSTTTRDQVANKLLKI
jgi:hypothetical protein